MNKDFISRTALMERILELAKAIAHENGTVDAITFAMKEAFDMAKEAPAVDVVPMDFHERCLELEVKKRIAAEKTARQCIENYEPLRHGRWLKDGSIGAIGSYCSLCDKRVKPDANYNYCPNCGAKMDAEVEG